MKNAFSFINEISVSYTRKQFRDKGLRSSCSVNELLREIYSASQSEMDVKEYFFIILLNRANKVIGYHKLSEGGICATQVDLRIAFATALKSLAVGMIMAHNHPSGNLAPSEQDIILTKKFVDAGKLFDITVLDHLIITSSGYYSFNDEGAL